MEESKVKSLSKAMNLLDIFTMPPYSYGVSEVARNFNCPKTSVHNIFSTLALYGLLKFDATTQKYTLGYKAAELGNAFRKSNSLLSIVRPYLTRLSAELKETIYLGTLSDDMVLYLDVAYSPFSTGGDVIGHKAPLHCTGIGKALLAHMDSESINRILSRPLQAFTPDTKTSPQELLDEISFIRENGYSVDNMEHEFGVKCVAVPLFDEDGQTKGAISISGPSLRFPEATIKKYSVILKEIAQKVRPIL